MKSILFMACVAVLTIGAMTALAQSPQPQQVDKSQLLPNVQVVPDGIGEIVAKQRAGWGYIKVGH